jgi:endonuclease-3
MVTTSPAARLLLPSHAMTDALPFDLPRTTAASKARAMQLYEALSAAYPDAHCELNYSAPHELLIATILSAQTTDVAVNKVTPELFRKFPTPAAFAASTPEEIEPYIRTIGLFRNKAKAVHAAMTLLIDRFKGEVPRTMDELLQLRGVARKTANVVLGNVFKINEGVVVDTHVERLSKRLGLAPADATVAMVERHLMSLFPREQWCQLSHLLIFHGRRACSARMATCCDHGICREFGTRCELPRTPAVKASKTTAPKAKGVQAKPKAPRRRGS